MYVNIKKMRRQLGLTQEEFANKLNYGQTTISFLEKGLRSLPQDKYNDLCQTFGTDFVEKFVEPDPQVSRIPNIPDLSSINELVPIIKEQQRQTNELIELLRQSLNFIKEMAQK